MDKTLVLNTFNIIIVVLLLVLSVLVFLDCWKKSGSFSKTLTWALLCLYFFPPIGLIIFRLSYRKTLGDKRDMDLGK